MMNINTDEKIDSIPKLRAKLDNLFSQGHSYDDNYLNIKCVLQSVELSNEELSKYTFFDFEKPYTRNLAATDEKQYTLLVLCWSPGKESKIHNHPCDGCFIKTLSGCIREIQYTTDETTDEIRKSKVRFYNEGQVSYMCDDMGLHKIGNPGAVCAVTLHLYTPPFQSCKVWSQDGAGTLSQSSVGVMGYFSAYGLRTPAAEGRPGAHALMLREIVQRVKST